MIHSLHYKLTHAARSIEKWTSDVQNPSRIAMLNNKLFFTKFFRKFHNSLEVLKHDSVVTSYNPLTQQCVFPWYYMVKIRQKITFIAHYHCVQVKRLFFILIKHKKMICIQYFCLDIVQVIYHLLCGATYSNQAYYCVLSSSISYPKSFNVVLC